MEWYGPLTALPSIGLITLSGVLTTAALTVVRYHQIVREKANDEDTIMCAFSIHRRP
jgi:hypothetical protein